MSRYRDENTESKVYVGDLPRDAEERELERAFGHYGPLKSVWVARNPPGFAFLEFEDPRDAEDAVRALDGTLVYTQVPLGYQLSLGAPLWTVQF